MHEVVGEEEREGGFSLKLLQRAKQETQPCQTAVLHILIQYSLYHLIHKQVMMHIQWDLLHTDKLHSQAHQVSLGFAFFG